MHNLNIIKNQLTNKLVDNCFESIFGSIPEPRSERLVDLKPITIEHFETDLKRNTPMIIGKKDGVDTNKEERICLASLFPDTKISSFTMKTDQTPTPSQLFTFFQSSFYDVFGGTGLNKGQFYGMQNLPIDFKLADEAVSYLSLLATPAVIKNNKAYAYNTKILVITDEEMYCSGLEPGNNVIIINENLIPLGGQFRALINGKSIAKGSGVHASQLLKLGKGIEIKDEYYQYDIIMSEDNIKVGKLSSDSYEGVYMVTWDNEATISGPVGHSFEFYQFLKYNKYVKDLIVNSFPKTDYMQILIGDRKGKLIQKAKDGEPYKPLEIETAIEQGLIAFGPEYPAVNESLRKNMLNWLINSRMPESNMKLVVMVTNAVENAIKIDNGNANGLLYKFPITAGIAKVRVTDTAKNLPFYAVQSSTCRAINADGDGDVIMLNLGNITDTIIKKGLVKKLRDINVAGRAKNASIFNFQNLAKVFSKILANNGLIGSLTMAYYRAEIGNEMLKAEVDLSNYYKAIESVIKSNKWDMDLSILEKRDYSMEKLLKTEIVDIWREKYWSESMLEIFKNGFDDSLIEGFIKKYSISNPLHYMDYIWNSVLTRTKKEIKDLEVIQKPLSYFAKFVEPQIIADEKAHSESFTLLKKLNHLFNISINAKDSKWFNKTKDLVELIKIASEELESSALSDFVLQYLQKSKGKGMFPLYFGNLQSIISGGIETKSKKSKKIGDICKNLFGIDVDKDSISEAVISAETSGDIKIKVWRSRPKVAEEQGVKIVNKTGFSIRPEEFAVGSTIEVKGNVVISGVKASINGTISDGKYEVVKSEVAYASNGSILETGIYITVKGVK